SLSGMRDLEDQVLTTSSIPSCIALVEEYLSQRLVELNNLRPIIQQYYQGIATPSTDLQTRRLQQRFKHEIGISPKTFQRTIRINQVIERLVAGPAKLTDLAYQAGYFDQSHFIRDFRHFTGLTPRTFLKSINPSGDFFNLRIH
ncbi:MAG: helix-turn-helix domain-containing protein, partial [Bacteroidota bacterium]